ncbi:hypothetical protein [Streptomyces sp. NPDC005423]|uniref:hypothetical protein n=1 Tax=Streptomyces sp. NPDC005423 TaxID=3155343 RepID=UPI0033BF4A3A
MSEPHGVDPRARDDPRNRYPSDEEFYGSDRPEGWSLPEDRPRGAPVETRHRGRFFTVMMIGLVVLIVVIWFLAFP